MARKSGWQQFADNFNSVYDAGTKFAKDSAFRDLDNRTLEEQLDEEGNLTGYKYGDKVYSDTNETGGLIKPSDEKLRLQNITDTQGIMRRFGDHKGAMEMGLKYADLEARQEENRINREIRDHLIYQRGIGKSDSMKADTDNTNASTTDTQSKTNERNALLDGRLRQQDANTANVKSQTNERDKLLSGKVDQQAATLDDTKTTTGLNQVKLKTARETQASDSASQVAENKNSLTETEISQTKNNAILELERRIANGEIKGFDAIKENVLEVATQTGDPDLLARVKAMNGQQLAELLHDGQKIRAEATAALSTGDPQDIVDLIDSRDGIKGNIKLQTTDGGFFRLVHLNSEGYVDESQPIIEGEDWNSFGQSVMSTLDPMTALDISTKQASIDNKKADTGLKKAEARELDGKAESVLSKEKSSRRAAFMSSSAYATLAADPETSEADILNAYEAWVEGEDSLEGFKIVE